MNNEHPTEHALGNPAATVALVFDLDGTLVKTDVFLESALQLVGREPFGAFKLLGWVFLGKAELKRRECQQTATKARRECAHGRGSGHV